MDELAGGWFYESFVEMLGEHAPYRGALTAQGMIRLLLTHKVIKQNRPHELCEVLWSVEDKEGFRAWAAAVRMGMDPTDAVEVFSHKKG